VHHPDGIARLPRATYHAGCPEPQARLLMRRLSRQIVAAVILFGIVAVAACVSIQVEPLTGQIYPPKHKFYTRAMAGIGP